VKRDKDVKGVKEVKTYAVAFGLACAFLTSPAFAQNLAVSQPGVGFSALAGGPSPAPQTISVTSTPAAGANWTITSTQPAWLTVTPATGATPGTLTFAVNVAGLAPGTYRANVVVTSPGPPPSTKTITVTLTVVAPAPNQSVYVVEFRYVGYVGLATAYPDCPVNPKGTDILRGIVVGSEGVPAGENVVYSGTLVRLTSVDFCETRGRRNPDDDERVWCAAKLIGTAAMKVDLEVYGEEGRGAWLKARHDGGPFTRSVTGSCDPADQLIWEKEYPRDDALKPGDPGDEGGGATPNGQPIDDPQSKLFVSGRARLVVGAFAPAQPDGWTLTVIAKLR
jgi:hypothetical protein